LTLFFAVNSDAYRRGPRVPADHLWRVLLRWKGSPIRASVIAHPSNSVIFVAAR